MKLSKKIKRTKNWLYSIDWKTSAIITLALTVGVLVMAGPSVQNIVIDWGNPDVQYIYVTVPGATSTTTTTTGTTTTTTSTTTTTTTTMAGEWYELEARIVWESWVSTDRYRNIEVGVSRMSDYVCIGSHTFARTEYNIWYHYTSFAVERDASVFLSAIPLIDGGDTFRYVVEDDPVYDSYHPISAGPWSAQFSFWDDSAPMPMGPAGWIQITWVRV